MNSFQLVSATLGAFPQAAPAFTRGKIIVAREMLTNESGLDDPFKLFDEPDLYNEGGAITTPTTEGWMPSYDAGAYPLSFYVDLGHDYQLDTVYLFDGNGTGNVTVSGGTPGAWTALFTDPLTNYEQWNKWPVGTTTRYVRVTYAQPLDAHGIRELVLYGTRVH